MALSRNVAASLVLALAAHAETRVHSSSEVTPLQKVISMLGEMLAKGKTEKHTEEVEFAEFQQWCDSTRDSTKKSIAEAEDKIVQLTADIAKADADAEEAETAAADIKPPSDWMWERFELVRTEYQVPKTYEPKLVPGLVVGLHNTHFWRFLRLRDNADMDASDHAGPEGMASGWTWERFHIVDAGNGEIALWCAVHNRFVRMWDNGKMDGSDWKGMNELPGDWTWERFVEVDAGYGQIALWSKVHNRFVVMTDNQDMWGSDHKGKDELLPPAEWTWERFTVVQG